MKRMEELRRLERCADVGGFATLSPESFRCLMDVVEAAQGISPLLRHEDMCAGWNVAYACDCPVGLLIDALISLEEDE